MSFCWTSPPVAGQIAPYVFSLVGKEQGLPPDEEHAFLFQDSRGFLWISSLSALYRFDGALVKPYLPDSTRKNWLHPGFIQHKLLEDKQGRIWITNGNAVFYYHPLKEQFFRISAGDSSQGYILLHINPDGRLWGLKGGTLFFRQNGKSVFPENGSFSGPNARYAAETDAKGFLKRVIATPVMAPGFEVLDIAGGNVISVQSFNPPLGKKEPDIYVERLQADNDTLVWLCSKGRLIAFNPRAPERLKVYLPEGWPDADVNVVATLDSNRLVVGTRKAGLWIFNKQSRRFEARLNKGQGNFSMSSSDKIESAFTGSKKSHLWVSFSNQGLGSASLFMPKLQRLENVNGLKLRDARFASKDLYGGFWFVNAAEAVHVLNDNSAYAVKLPENLPISSIWNFFTDSHGRPWLHAGGKIFYIPANSRSWERLPVVLDKEITKAITPLRDGRLLIITNLQTFAIHERSPGIFIKSNPIKEIEIADEKVLAFPLSEGYLALQGIKESNLQIYKTDGNDFRKIAEMPHMPYTNKSIWDKARESIWLATTDGLKRISNDFQTVESFFQGNEWLDRVGVKDVLLDKFNRLWLAGPDMLVLFIPESDSVRIFRQEELRAGPFLFATAVAASDGRFFFGARDGVIAFDPERLKPYPDAPRPYIYDIQINGAQLDSLNPAALKTLELTYHQRNIRLTLAAIGYYLPQYTRLQYRLKGSDKDWQITKPGEHLNYRLIWGKGQVFQMRAIGPNGQQSPPRELAISVAPPFWLSWQFIFGSITALAGIVVLIVNYFVKKRLKEEANRQKLIEEEWSRMMNDLHDGIGFDLTAIRAMSERASRNIQDPEIRDQFERIYRRALDGMRSMGEIFRVTEDQAAGIDVFIEFLYQRSKEYLDSMGLEQAFNWPADLPAAEVGAEQRQNMWLVLKESLNNTSKHAAATKVVIDLWLDGRFLFLRVRDNGCGFDPSVPRSGRGSRNMPKRMQSIGGTYSLESSPKGTVILLSCPVKFSFRPAKRWAIFRKKSNSSNLDH
ncbi:MAG: hypothetical protein IPH16_05420 [Haliscomenobacter sp.]|nr:hypothetical protein [Haliscomenobacter sp.]